jgi:hypothetical protein
VALAELPDWLDDHSGPQFIWYVKRLSGNDTLANGSHQAGPYMTKPFLFRVFPAINTRAVLNPRVQFVFYTDSHVDHRQVSAIYYNNRFHGGTRDEARITGFGGHTSALLDAESTGALTVFAFRLDAAGAAIKCHAWVCRHETEEEIVEDRIGPVEPGKQVIWPPAAPGLPLEAAPLVRTSCWLDPHEMPPAWLGAFPRGADIISKAVELRPDSALPPDKRLLRRRDCEFEIFRSVEQAIELPRIAAGFATVEDFIASARTVLQRRKARSGRSLELHTREIFVEEHLVEGTHFSHQPESDPGKRPDFLFPSEAAYKNPNFPATRLRMLATKTTCKDRWRQITVEADRVSTKHLLTLQEGISISQFSEMKSLNVQLVVPSPLAEKYPSSIRSELMTLEGFLAEVRTLV